MNQTAYSDVRVALNDHVVRCSVCRSEVWGICPEADELLDELLAVLQAPREDDE